MSRWRAKHFPNGSLNMTVFDLLFANSSDKRGEVMTMVRKANVAKRWQDMTLFLKWLVYRVCLSYKLPLTVEERRMMSVCYKNILSSQRAVLLRASAAAETAVGETAKDAMRAYYNYVKAELVQTCKGVLVLLDDLLPTTVGDPESSVCYQKMSGDFYRYLAEADEVKSSLHHEKAKRFYADAYAEAIDIKLNERDPNLAPTHPNFLGLILNYSVLLYDIFEERKPAYEMAKQAAEEAITKLDTLDKDQAYRETVAVIQMMKDNLAIWAAETDGLEGSDEELSAEDDYL